MKNFQKEEEILTQTNPTRLLDPRSLAPFRRRLHGLQKGVEHNHPLRRWQWIQKIGVYVLVRMFNMLIFVCRSAHLPGITGIRSERPQDALAAELAVAGGPICRGG